MNFCFRWLIFCPVVAIISSLLDNAQASSKKECVHKLIDFCNKQHFPYDITKHFFDSIDYSMGKGVLFSCRRDMSGVNCTADGVPWYSCSSDHSATYRGKLLSVNKTKGVDGEICKASEQLTKGQFKEVFFGNKLPPQENEDSEEDDDEDTSKENGDSGEDYDEDTSQEYGDTGEADVDADEENGNYSGEDYDEDTSQEYGHWTFSF